MQLPAGNSAITATFTLQGHHPEAKLQVPRKYSSSPTLPKPTLNLGIHRSYSSSVQPKMEKLWRKLAGSRSTPSPARASPGVPELWGCQACSCYHRAHHPRPLPTGGHNGDSRRDITATHPLPAGGAGQVLLALQSSGHAAPSAAAPGRCGSRRCRDARVTPRSPSLLRRSIPATAAPRGPSPVPPPPHTGHGPGSTGSPPGHGLTWRAGAAPPSYCPPRRARSW